MRVKPRRVTKFKRFDPTAYFNKLSDMSYDDNLAPSKDYSTHNRTFQSRLRKPVTYTPL